MIGASLKGVSFSYGTREVLRDVSFDVAEGEMLGVVGPNGSGKTTLIGLVSGVLAAGAGEVRVGARPVGSYGRRDLSKMVAVVPQAVDTVFPYTVAEVVAIGRYPHLGLGGWMGPHDRDAVERAMELTGTTDFRDRPVDRLSAGERQRVFLARALAQEPALLLLDEASSFLDIGQEMGIFRVLDRLRRTEGLTILTVSHDLNLVGAFCHKAVLLKGGQVRGAGPLEQVYTSESLSTLFDTAVTTGARKGGGVTVTW